MDAGKKAQVSVDDTYSEELDDYGLRRVLQGALCQNKGQDGLVIFWTALPVPTLSILTLPRATEPWARMRAASAALWIGRKILWATSTMKRGEIWWVISIHPSALKSEKPGLLSLSATIHRTSSANGYRWFRPLATPTSSIRLNATLRSRVKPRKSWPTK